jgi:4-hydroxy-3-polyprenylbenzoate decarboxylase
MVKTGPIKENINKSNINLYQFPVPQWHYLDGGRYINTFCGVVTKDPETKITNVGLYRGMIIDKDKIGVLLVPSQGWGLHYQKYQMMKKPMPVAVVYGYDEALVFTAAAPLPRDCDEYKVTGSLRQEPINLVKCETVDLEVPAEAEIVIEGYISTNPEDHKVEGPFGEYAGYYGESGKRPVIRVSFSYRDDDIPGRLEERSLNPNEDSSMLLVSLSAMARYFKSQGVQVLEINPAPITIVKIKKLSGHRSKVQQHCGALPTQHLLELSSGQGLDIWNKVVESHCLWCKCRENDIVIFPGTGALSDPSTRIEDRRVTIWGSSDLQFLLTLQEVELCKRSESRMKFISFLHPPF